MKTAVLALFAAIALAPGAALALEKCVDAGGKVSYVDRCPAGTTRAPSSTDERIIPKTPPAPVITKPELEPVPGAMTPVPIPMASPVEAAAPPKPAAVPASSAQAAAAPAARAALPADVKIDYYDVEGTDQPSLVKALNARGGGHAKSSWKLSYQYQPRREKEMCGVGTVATQLELAMTLPRWTPHEGASADLVQRWTKYVDALMAHENARLDKARELERDLKPALQALPLAADCNALDAAVVERYEALQQQSSRDAEAAQGDGPVFE